MASEPQILKQGLRCIENKRFKGLEIVRFFKKILVSVYLLYNILILFSEILKFLGRIDLWASYKKFRDILYASPIVSDKITLSLLIPLIAVYLYTIQISKSNVSTGFTHNICPLSEQHYQNLKSNFCGATSFSLALFITYTYNSNIFRYVSFYFSKSHVKWPFFV